MIIQAPISIGDLIDKITILEIKLKNFVSVEKINNVVKELDFLQKLLVGLGLDLIKIQNLIFELKSINEVLWNAENMIRHLISSEKLDEKFIEISLEIRKMNDRRGEIKKQINITTNSTIVEEKEYN